LLIPIRNAKNHAAELNEAGVFHGAKLARKLFGIVEASNDISVQSAKVLKHNRQGELPP
jgi:hypothetical protein